MMLQSVYFLWMHMHVKPYHLENLLTSIPVVASWVTTMSAADREPTILFVMLTGLESKNTYLLH